jgi:hypothetical protein
MAMIKNRYANQCNEAPIYAAPISPDQCLQMLEEIGGIYRELMGGAAGQPMKTDRVRRAVGRMNELADAPQRTPTSYGRLAEEAAMIAQFNDIGTSLDTLKLKLEDL